jgi:hypothetical protein
VTFSKVSHNHPNGLKVEDVSSSNIEELTNTSNYNDLVNTVNFEITTLKFYRTFYNRMTTISSKLITENLISLTFVQSNL